MTKPKAKEKKLKGWEPQTTCGVCDIPIEGHARCSACEILVGPTHLEPMLVDSPHYEKPVCQHCGDKAEERAERQAR